MFTHPSRYRNILKKVLARGRQAWPPVLLCLLAIMATPVIVLANGNMNAPVPTSITDQPSSPVGIDNCTAVANDFVNSRVSPPAYAYTQVTVMVSFRNNGKVAASAVKFGFTFEDSFNAVLATDYATIHGSYAPGVLIEPHRAGLLNAFQDDAAVWAVSLNNQDIGRVKCFVSSVRFEDGTVWTPK